MSLNPGHLDFEVKGQESSFLKVLRIIQEEGDIGVSD